jgi:hypothetical protein
MEKTLNGRSESKKKKKQKERRKERKRQFPFFLSPSLSLSLPYIHTYTLSISLCVCVCVTMARGSKNMLVVGGVVIGTLAAMVPVIVMPLFQQDSYGDSSKRERERERQIVIMAEYKREREREGQLGTERGEERVEMYRNPSLSLSLSCFPLLTLDCIHTTPHSTQLISRRSF